MNPSALQLAFWLGTPVALMLACVLIARYQRRQLSWLDRVDELRRDEAA